MNIKLTPELKSALELRHSKVRDGYERDRIKVVLLHAKGWTIVMIAQVLLVHESTIFRHIKDFIDEQKLTLENGGSFSHLNSGQIKQLIEHLSDITYFILIKFVAISKPFLALSIQYQDLINGYTKMVLIINSQKEFLISFVPLSKMTS